MGATGSGKSALALEIAQRAPTVIINADAMQMYRDLRILTARPSAQEEAQAEHRLYGVLDAGERGSVARWLPLAAAEIRRAWEQGKRPLLVGGTGMYVKALIDGLAELPPIPQEVRQRLRAMDPAERRALLETKDPAMAAVLKPGDTQRNLRALEVLEATGRSLRDWQDAPETPVFPDAEYACFHTELPRAELYERLDARFLAMLEQGALEEVKALHARRLPASLPLMRAVGVPQLCAFLDGSMAREEAIAGAQQATRNYAKRQMTWLRSQMPGAALISSGDTIQ